MVPLQEFSRAQATRIRRKHWSLVNRRQQLILEIATAEEELAKANLDLKRTSEILKEKIKTLKQRIQYRKRSLNQLST